jgi:hypothetical protein
MTRRRPTPAQLRIIPPRHPQDRRIHPPFRLLRALPAAWSGRYAVPAYTAHVRERRSPGASVITRQVAPSDEIGSEVPRRPNGRMRAQPVELSPSTTNPSRSRSDRLRDTRRAAADAGGRRGHSRHLSIGGTRSRHHWGAWPAPCCCRQVGVRARAVLDAAMYRPRYRRSASRVRPAFPGPG